MKKLDDYAQLFRSLNEEENQINSRHYSDNPSEAYQMKQEALETFYEKKNKVAVDFIRDVNNSNIVDNDGKTIDFFDGQNNKLEYDKSDHFYYDHIYINFGENEYFTILPPVVSKTREGTDELFELMTTMEVYPWSEIRECKSLKRLGELTDEIRDYELGDEAFYDDGKDSYYHYLVKKVKGEIEEAGKNAEKCIQEAQQTYGLTYEEASYLMDISNGKNTDFLSEVIKKYSIEALESEFSSPNPWPTLGEEIAMMEIDGLDIEKIKVDLDGFILEHIGDVEDLSYGYRQLFINSVELGEETVQALNDYRDLQALSQNPFLTSSQIRDLIAQFNQNDEILTNIFAKHEIDEEIIIEMLNGSERDRNIIVQYCRNIPEEQMKRVLFEDGNKYADWQLGCMIKNNQNLSSEFIGTIMDSDYATSNDICSSLMGQANVPKERAIELIQNGGLETFFDLLDSEEKMTYPTEVYDYAIEHSSIWGKNSIAKAIIAGKISASDECLRKLALDRNLDEKCRIELAEMPEYEEIIPEIDDSEQMKVSYYYNRYGERTGGPGEFDNMGGALEFYVNGVMISSNKAPCKSSGKTAEDRKWARNAYTDFSECIEPNQFIDFCNEHKRAILIMAYNNDFFSVNKRFYGEEIEGNLLTRVTQIESELRLIDATKEIYGDISPEELRETIRSIKKDPREAFLKNFENQGIQVSSDEDGRKEATIEGVQLYDDEPEYVIWINFEDMTVNVANELGGWSYSMYEVLYKSNDMIIAEIRRTLGIASEARELSSDVAQQSHDISEIAEAVDGVTLDEHQATVRETKENLMVQTHEKNVQNHDDDEQNK